MHHGKVFEANLIKDLREVFHYQVEASSIEMDQKEKIDFKLSGRTLPLSINTQVTEQSDDGSKLAIFLRRGWFRDSDDPQLYVIAEGTVSMIVAQAMHRAFWRDLAGIIKPRCSYALWVTNDGFGTLHDPRILARDLILALHAKTANSLRRRGRVVSVEGGLIIIARDNKQYCASLSEVVGGHGFNRFTAKNLVQRKRFVTFLPIDGEMKGISRATAIMVAKRTKHRKEAHEATG
jgi:hypothetical protein